MKSKPKLCFVGPMLGRHKGAVPNPVELLAPQLENEGYETFLISSIKNRYLRMGDIGWQLAFRGGLFDLIFLQVYSGPSFVVEDLASWIAKVIRRPTVMTIHGGAFPAFELKFPKWSLRVLRRAAVITVPSLYLARTIQKMGFTPRVIPNAINLEGYVYKKRREILPRLFWMRAFHDIYNPMLALKTLKLVKKKFPEATLIMAGSDMGLFHYIQKEAVKMNLKGAVMFPGFLNQEGKNKAANDCDIYLNTNRIDNMPVSVIEAAAMGLPVVATEVGGIADLLTHEENSLLVPDNDAVKAADAVIRLIEEPQLTEKIAVNGRNMAEKFSWENVLPLWIDLINEVKKNG